VKIVIPGGSGQVGTILARAFVAEGHEVVVLSRRQYAATWRVVAWDGATVGDWAREIDRSDVVINLAGRSVNCRYTAANRREILESRVRSTRAVGSAIAAATRPPRVWLQASTATIYAHRFDASNDESSGVIGGNEPGAPETWRFSIEVANAWEAALNEAQVTSTRRVALRSAIVMSPDRGGAFDTLCNLVRFGVGGQQASGRQFVSWIHHEDFVSALSWLIAHEEIAGPVNVAAPEPLANAEFMRDLRRAARMPIGLPATSLMLEMGAFVLRTETELILKSRRVVPARLVKSGFEFRFPSWLAAAVELWAERTSTR
jgi:uncharacterized protein (TIGR01777 family)